ncbi:MAG: hypothetical protein E7592_06145 [Ruminococcaceae bacterium]|nr:hypothetical protein [Oscillospiraceae bacterium]
MASENKLQGVVQATLSEIRNLIDADTVMGTPVETSSGTTLIPISKVAVGYATGGMDFNDKNSAQGKPQNFGAGGGTGISVQPIGILCISKDGSVELINIGVKNPSDPVEQLSDLIDRAPEIIAKVKALFAKDKPEEETEEKTEG